MKSRDQRTSGTLTIQELASSLTRIVKLAQGECFQQDITNLMQYGEVKNKSTLKSLYAFLDEQGLIRVGGRLRHANIHYNQKHPILLHHKHQLTYLILEHEHKRQLHAGPQLLLACVRKTFWPLNGRKLARKIVRQCVVCFRTNPKPSEQLMGSLPAARVQPTRPFYNCGVDNCRPCLLYTS